MLQQKKKKKQKKQKKKKRFNLPHSKMNPSTTTPYKASAKQRIRQARKRRIVTGLPEQPSLAQKLWDASSDNVLHAFLLTERLQASTEQAKMVVNRGWAALPLWARRGLKKIAAARESRAKEMSDRERNYYGISPASPQEI